LVATRATTEDLARRLGLDPASAWLGVALTHSSYAAEHAQESNERLEYLGDAVVDLAVADHLVRAYPALDPGAASLVRSRVVNEAALAEAASRLGLSAEVRVGRGELKKGGLTRPSLLADAFEAVVAALYLERGFEAAGAFVVSCLAEAIAEAAARPREVDPKARLAQWAMARGLGRPHYDVVADGPSHERRFEATVTVGEWRAHGEGRSKKAAEAAAAEAAWEARDA
jgi:ribonuclease-3